MRLRLTLLGPVLVVALVLSGCSRGEPTTISPGAPSSSLPVATTAAVPDAGVLYLQHAVTARIEPDGEAFTLTLQGVERHSQWLTATDSGVVSLEQLTHDWTFLGFEQEPPQAALVPASTDEAGLLLELGEPEWDESSRVLVYTATVPGTPDPRLEGMVGPPTDSPPSDLGALTVVLHATDGDAIPEPGPTTTTTTSTTTPGPTTTAPDATTTSTVALPTSGSEPPTVATTATTVFVAPPPPPPTEPPRPPEGDPRIVANVDSVRLPTAGGTTTFALRNLGTGVGSWSITAPTSVGITAAPSAGLLFPGSSTSIRVSYNGTHSADDFSTSLTIVTPTGRITVRVEVAGD